MSPGLQAILDVLDMDGPSTPKEIAARTGLAYRSLYSSEMNYIGKLHGEKRIYIAGWRRQTGHGGPPQPVYALGKGKDTPRPKPKSSSERCRQWRIAKRAVARTDKSIIALVLGTRMAKGGDHAGA